jgi:serine/threonine protein kinase, bacterial
VAVGGAGNVYVTDANNRIVKLAAGSSSQTVVPFDQSLGPRGVAVDAAGNIYVTDGRVVKLAAGSFTPTVLWSPDHTRGAGGVVVDAVGNLYFNELLSEGQDRMLKLPVQ